MEPIDVLVVGAGPTGLMAALQLASSGVRVRIVDERAGATTESRAFAVQARSLELLASFGLADALVARGERGAKEVRAHVDGQLAVRLPLDDFGVEGAPYPYLLFASQGDTERLLEDALVAVGGHVEREMTIVACVDEGSEVRARARRADGSEEVIRARWVIGCDGAHSRVREAAGLSFRGGRYPQDFVLADVEVDWEGPRDALSLYLAPTGLLAVFPFAHHGWYRLIASGGRSAQGELSLREMQAIVDRLAPMPMRLHDPRWLARFHLHHRGVDAYRRGRLFVAGDAAHIHSPVGGQGMNTGLQDAANLGWKLALVAKGIAPDALLDTYDEERRPIGRRLLRTTDRLFTIAVPRTGVGRAARDAFARHVMPWIVRGDRGRARALRFVSELGIEYPRSSIVIERTRGTGDRLYRDGPRPGRRAPDGALLAREGATTLFARLDGVANHLVAFGGPTSRDARPILTALAPLGAIPWMRTHVVLGRTPSHAWLDGACVDAHGEVHARYGLRSTGLYVIRPDGYVGMRARRIDPADVAAYAKALGARIDLGAPRAAPHGVVQAKTA